MTIEEPTHPLLEGIESGLRGMLGIILDKGIDDLDGPIREISQRLALAAILGRTDLAVACQDHIMLIVLERELQVRDGMGSFWRGVITMGINAIISSATGGLLARPRP